MIKTTNIYCVPGMCQVLFQILHIPSRCANMATAHSQYVCAHPVQLLTCVRTFRPGSVAQYLLSCTRTRIYYKGANHCTGLFKHAHRCTHMYTVHALSSHTYASFLVQYVRATHTYSSATPEWYTLARAPPACVTGSYTRHTQILTL